METSDRYEELYYLCWECGSQRKGGASEMRSQREKEGARERENEGGERLLSPPLALSLISVSNVRSLPAPRTSSVAPCLATQGDKIETEESGRAKGWDSLMLA